MYKDIYFVARFDRLRLKEGVNVGSILFDKKREDLNKAVVLFKQYTRTSNCVKNLEVIYTYNIPGEESEVQVYNETVYANQDSQKRKLSGWKFIYLVRKTKPTTVICG